MSIIWPTTFFAGHTRKKKVQKKSKCTISPPQATKVLGARTTRTQESGEESWKV